VLAKEIERAGIPAVYVTSLPTVATMIGANRIVRGPAITHPFGIDEDERRLGDDAAGGAVRLLHRHADGPHAELSDRGRASRHRLLLDW